MWKSIYVRTISILVLWTGVYIRTLTVLPPTDARVHVCTWTVLVSLIWRLCVRTWTKLPWEGVCVHGWANSCVLRTRWDSSHSNQINKIGQNWTKLILMNSLPRWRRNHRARGRGGGGFFTTVHYSSRCTVDRTHRVRRMGVLYQASLYLYPANITVFSIITRRDIFNVLSTSHSSTKSTKLGVMAVGMGERRGYWFSDQSEPRRQPGDQSGRRSGLPFGTIGRLERI